ncbi:MAG: phospholipase D-like domain-containing protein [Polyangia bacterium]
MEAVPAAPLETPCTTHTTLRALARQAFARAAGAPLSEGNHVELLKDAKQNYPAWLEAICSAKQYVDFENYIVCDDEVGRRFADALIAAAARGVKVRLAYDWLGCVGRASRRFWRRLREGGVEVRCYNPPRWDSPVAWLSRNHRKTLSVDGEVGFVAGLCVGNSWMGNPAKKREPWRDTGVELRGPAVQQIEDAFAMIWASLGSAIPARTSSSRIDAAIAGGTALRVIASMPATAGLLRVNELVASLAVRRLWLTDAYFVGSTAYVQALIAAAKDGVDVRLLVPGGTDIPILRGLSRAGYRPLLRAGVRVFEWNGTMIHAKSSVADTRWARVGSTNLNVASWFGNCELDVLVEDEAFAGLMEAAYLDDLTHATELVLGRHGRASLRPSDAAATNPAHQDGGGQVATGAARIGHAVGAALSATRVLEPEDASLTLSGAAGLTVFAVLFALFPRALAYPVAAVLAWVAAGLLHKGWALHRIHARQLAEQRRDPPEPVMRDGDE